MTSNKIYVYNCTEGTGTLNLISIAPDKDFKNLLVCGSASILYYIIQSL